MVHRRQGWAQEQRGRREVAAGSSAEDTQGWMGGLNCGLQKAGLMMRGPLAPPDGSGEPTQPGSRSMPTSTAQSTRSSSSISSSAKALLSREAPELTDRVGSLEVGQHEDVEELGAGSRSEGVEAFAESTL